MRPKWTPAELEEMRLADAEIDAACEIEFRRTEKKREYDRQWMAAHPDYKKAYYAANRERILAQRREYYVRNREREIERAAQYRADHWEEIRRKKREKRKAATA